MGWLDKLLGFLGKILGVLFVTKQVEGKVEAREELEDAKAENDARQEWDRIDATPVDSGAAYDQLRESADKSSDRVSGVPGSDPRRGGPAPNAR